MEMRDKNNKNLLSRRMVFLSEVTVFNVFVI